MSANDKILDITDNFLSKLGYNAESYITYADFLKIIQTATKSVANKNNGTDIPFILLNDEYQKSIKLNSRLDFFTILHIKCKNRKCYADSYISIFDIITNMLTRQGEWCPECINRIDKLKKERLESQQEEAIRKQFDKQASVSDINSNLYGNFEYDHRNKKYYFNENSGEEFMSENYSTFNNIIVEKEKGYLDKDGHFRSGIDPRKLKSTTDTRKKIDRTNRESFINTNSQKSNIQTRIIEENSSFNANRYNISDQDHLDFEERKAKQAKQREEYLKRREKLRLQELEKESKQVKEIITESPDDIALQSGMNPTTYKEQETSYSAENNHLNEYSTENQINTNSSQYETSYKEYKQEKILDELKKETVSSDNNEDFDVNKYEQADISEIEAGSILENNSKYVENDKNIIPVKSFKKRVIPNQN